MSVFKDIGFQQLNSQISILDKAVEKNKNDIASGGGGGSEKVHTNQDNGATHVGSTSQPDHVSNNKGNTTIGVEAGISTSGDDNTIIGYNAAEKCTSGNNNVIIGADAAPVFTTGNDNIVIGNSARLDTALGGAQNQIVIGQGATGHGDNTAVIGNADVTDVYMAQDSGANVYCGAITTSGNLAVTGTITGETSLTLDNTTITTAEIGVLEGVTPGTAAASKAVVLDASKDITSIRNLTIDGTFSDGNYTFDTSGNLSGLGTVGCGAITTSSNTITMNSRELVLDSIGGDARKFRMSIGGDTPPAKAPSFFVGTTPPSISNAQMNVAVGPQFLDTGNITRGTMYKLTTGDYNTAVGAECAQNLTSSPYNTMVGYRCCNALEDGDGLNVAVGRWALKFTEAGSRNTAVGDRAGAGVGTGADSLRNTAVGYCALSGGCGADSATMAENTAIGAIAGESITTGSNNTLLGSQVGNIGSSLNNLTTGSNNVLIGFRAMPGPDPLVPHDGSAASNQIVIGKGATGTGDNKAVIGNADVTDVYMAQDSGATVHCGGIIATANDADVAHDEAIPLTTYSSGFKTDGAETSTLAAGTEGQIKVLYMHTYGGNMEVTVANAGWKGSGTGTITFEQVGAACTLQYLDSKWFVIGLGDHVEMDEDP